MPEGDTWQLGAVTCRGSRVWDHGSVICNSGDSYPGISSQICSGGDCGGDGRWLAADLLSAPWLQLLQANIGTSMILRGYGALFSAEGWLVRAAFRSQSATALQALLPRIPGGGGALYTIAG